MLHTAEPASSTFEDQLYAEVAAALRQSGYFDPDELEINVDGHDVVLSGWLGSNFQKQKAEFIVRSLPSVGTLSSEIGVCRG